MSLLQGLARLVMRAARDVDGRVLRALHDLWRTSFMSGRTPARSGGIASGGVASGWPVATPLPARTDVEQSRLRRKSSAGMHTIPRPDHRDLTRADVELIWLKRNNCVVSAIHNFAALRFIRLPVHGAAGWEIETPLRDVVNVVGANEGLSKLQRTQVYNAVLIACVTLPLGMALPSPFGIVDELDQIIADAPEITAAVQAVWSIVDDPELWTAVGRRRTQLAAV